MNYDRLVGEKALGLAYAALTQAGRYGLSVSRRNYEIMLVCLLRTSPDLSAAVRDLIAGGHKLTETVMDNLYERFLSRPRFTTQVIETGSRITIEIADALDALEKASASTQSYGSALDQAAQSLASAANDRQALGRLISGLATSTTAMSAQNAALGARLAQSSKEIEKLRSSLRDARAESLTDALTGVANRKLFDDTLRARIEEADADASDLALMLADIDSFKAFNDTWGHLTGDQVIRFVASTLVKFALPDHLVARYGGEEFAIIMPRASLEEARRIAESARTAIERKRLIRRSTGETIGAVTVSFGVARYVSGEPMGQLISRADEYLYFSKRNGRNRVTHEMAPADAAREFRAAPARVLSQHPLTATSGIGPEIGPWRREAL
jgi:diguanylate cyclase